MSQEVRRRAQPRHTQRLAFRVRHGVETRRGFPRYQLDQPRTLAEYHERFDVLAAALQVNGVIVKTDRALDRTGEQFRGGIDAGRLRQDLEFESFVLEIT